MPTGAAVQPATERWRQLRPRSHPIRCRQSLPRCSGCRRRSRNAGATLERSDISESDARRGDLRQTQARSIGSVTRTERRRRGVIDRALTLLVAELERTKVAKIARPGRTTKSSRRPSPRGASSARHIPASIRRTVWARDEGRCAFVGARGRCTETGHLEFHHLIPFADGGPTSIENLALRCRAHNAHEARLWSPM